jgi:glycosyltransferase involved in cell wall biosynthesis
MSNPLVSVIMPVYNGAAYLRQAIQSALGQTYEPIEVVVVDDGSTDESPAVLSGFRSQLVLIRQHNAGVAAARNLAMRAARGEYYAFLDQDDWWLREKIARQMALFPQDNRLGLVHTAILSFDQHSAQCGSHPSRSACPQQLVGDCYERLLLGNSICNSSVVVARRAVEAVGDCDLVIEGNTVQDYDLWLRIARQFRLGFIGEPLTVFRIQPQQGQANWIKVRREEVKLLLRIRSAREWRGTLGGPERLADLYDELATLLLDRHRYAEARRMLAKALRFRRNCRQAARFAASLLPGPVVQRLRANSY